MSQASPDSPNSSIDPYKLPTAAMEAARHEFFRRSENVDRAVVAFLNVLLADDEALERAAWFLTRRSDWRDAVYVSDMRAALIAAVQEDQGAS